MERRKNQRNRIRVDIEIAHPGASRCHGYAENISRSGICVRLSAGSVPAHQRSVVLNFKVWTGTETLYRRVYARVVRGDGEQVALEFAEHDFITEAVIQDLMYYQSRERRAHPRQPVVHALALDTPAVAAKAPV